MTASLHLFATQATGSSMAATLTAGTDAEDRIAHLETSLATALARVEAGQLREQRLKRENAELRSLLRDAGLDSAEGKRDKDGQPLGPIIPQPGHSKRIGQNRSTSLEPCLDGDDLMQGVHALSVDIATPEGKVHIPPTSCTKPIFGPLIALLA